MLKNPLYLIRAAVIHLVFIELDSESLQMWTALEPWRFFSFSVP